MATLIRETTLLKIKPTPFLGFKRMFVYILTSIQNHVDCRFYTDLTNCIVSVFIGVLCVSRLQCRSGWISHRDSCYYFSQDSGTWFEAQVVIEYIAMFLNVKIPLRSIFTSILIGRLNKTSN